MIVLGVDTSSEQIGIGISKDGSLIGELSVSIKDKTHLKSLIPLIDKALTMVDLNLNSVDLFTVVVGPGSWSGIRIGVTTIKGISQTLNKEVVGISSLEALAYNLQYSNGTIYPIIDAARNQVYFGCYEWSNGSIVPHEENKLEKLDEFLTKPSPDSVLLGDGVLKYRKEILTNNRNVRLASDYYCFIKPGMLIEAALQKYSKSGPESFLTLKPLYLQKANAE